jgi:hypothetical protein
VCTLHRCVYTHTQQMSVECEGLSCRSRVYIAGSLVFFFLEKEGEKRKHVIATKQKLLSPILFIKTSFIHVSFSISR